MTHESKSKPCKNHSRPGVLEDHLSSQEGTLAVLLQQAFRITEEVAAGLQSSKGSVQVEALSRKLLESHILTITRVVKQLSIDIQALERQLTQRDSVTSGTTLALQSLDQKNMAGIGDLRGRVARCDASIAKLSADMNSGEQQMIRLQKEVAVLRSAVDVEVKELDIKLRHDLGRLQASWTECLQSQTRSMSDLQNRVKQLEDTVSCGLKEVKEQTEALRQWTEQQLNSSIHTHARCSQQLRSLLQDKMIEAESGLAEQLHALEAHVEHFQANQLKRSETKLSKRMTSVENSLQQELQLLKQEYHKGFLSVHDAIKSLRQIGDIKARLDKEMLQKDISHICCKVAELNDS